MGMGMEYLAWGMAMTSLGGVSQVKCFVLVATKSLDMPGPKNRDTTGTVVAVGGQECWPKRCQSRSQMAETKKSFSAL